MNHKRYRRGFTVIEVLIGVIIISILTSTIIFVYMRQQQTSRDDKRRADMTVLAHELDKHYEKTGNYPLSCSHTTPGSSTCTAMSSAYSSAYGLPVPPQVGGDSMTPSQIRTALSGIKESFGDPLSDSHGPLNAHVSPSANPIRRSSYVFVSPDALNTPFSVHLATDDSGSSSVTCNVTPTTNDYHGTNQGNRPHAYVIGYYSEVEEKWLLFGGPKLDSVNDLGWNSGGNSACDLSQLSSS